MIQLDKHSLKIGALHNSLKYAHLFGFLDIPFRKQGSGEHISWRHQERDLDIYHSGPFTWFSIKKTLEKYLNYENSYFRKVIIKRAFR